MDDDPHYRPERAEEEERRGFASDLLAHVRARKEAAEARTRNLLDLLTSGVEPEPQHDNPPDDLEEAA